MPQAIDSERRGKLTVFLGAAAGVGKTYAMLEAAKEKFAEGLDVVVGWVNTHGRQETELLLRGLPVLPPSGPVSHARNACEPDVDALLAQGPALVLIDEMARGNPAGSRHVKRYQDIEELLCAGIDVYTTLNIQQLESLNDIVTQITGIEVQETIPDRMLETARIRLVDVPAEELMLRLKEGKVYVPDLTVPAVKNFFRPGNINALREMAFRYAARLVDRQLESYMKVHHIPGPWPIGERVMVCVSPSPFSAQLIRVACRMAEGLQAEWLAVSVETLRRGPKSEMEKDSLAKNLRLAEELGAETLTMTGDDVAEEIVNLAIKRNVSLIIIGKPLRSRLWEWLHGSVVDKVIRLSQGISVHVIAGNFDQKQKKPVFAAEPEPFLISSYVWPLLMMAALTVFSSSLTNVLGLVNVAMLYLLPVLFSAAKWGTGPALVAAVMGAVTFDFFFVPPRLSFTVEDLRYLISFAIFLLVGLITGTLSTRLQKQVVVSRQREARVGALYALSREIAASPDLEAVLESVVRKVAETIDSQVELLLPDSDGKLKLTASSNHSRNSFIDERESAVAEWVFKRGQKAGRGTDTLGSVTGLYLPLQTEQEVQGVLAVQLNKADKLLQPEQLRLLEAFAGLATVAINRIRLAEKAREAQTLVESEKLRTALFNSLSHDLRTPLAFIIGAVTGLMEEENVYTAAARQDLLQTILQGAARMNRFVHNLLDMARLESGMLKLNREWCDIQDIVGVALSRLGESLSDRPLRISIQQDLPLVQADCVLIEQVLINLLDNALKYSESGSDIEISARREGPQVEVAVADQGTEIPEEDLGRIFDKFYRLKSPLQVSGTGLGLAICKGIVEAHGGIIWAENRAKGGVILTFSLPLGEMPNRMPIFDGGDHLGE